MINVLFILLSQASQPVIITNPTNPTKRVTTTTSGAKELLDVNCPGCTGGGGTTSGDGGYTVVIQGPGADGGVRWGVDAYQAGAWNITATSGDGGYTTVIQGPGADGGAAWGVTGTVSVVGPLSVNILDAGPPINVQGTFFQATQPVSAASLPLPTGASTETTLALIKAKTDNIDVVLSTRTKPADQQHVIVDSSATVAVTGPLTDAQLRATPVPVSGTVTATGPLTDTQLRATPVPISGTVTANAGTNLNTSALALSATQTDRTQKTQVTDGTRDGTVKAASTAAVAADTALVVAVSPNNSVAITAATLPLPTGAATSANQTTLGSQTTKLNDGVDTALVSGTGSLQVTCDNCGGSTFLDNSAFTFNTSPVVNVGAVVDDTGPNAVAENSAGAPRMSTRRELYNQLRDAAGNERGANVNASNALLTAQTGALPAGTNVIGHVIADTGSTTAVTGNVTVVQPTGTNLHAVLDTTSTTAVTQATGTNLHAVIDTGSTTAVTGNVTVVQPTGTNLHVVSDATSTTAVTQTTSPWVENVSQYGGVATSLGQKVMTASVPVVLASNQSTIGIDISSVSATVPISSLAGTMNREGLAASVTTTSSVCLAADVSRQGCSVCLDPEATAYVYVRFSASAATTSYTKLAPGGCVYCNFGNRVYFDAITCIAASGTQTVYMADID